MARGTAIQRVVIAYGSESGNAERLACRLTDVPSLHAYELVCKALDDIDLCRLSADDLLLVLTSTFGDGDPPGNAEGFSAALEALSPELHFSYAVFGLGDVAYAHFCAFGKRVDRVLAARGARRLISRVDADLDYEYFFAQWQETVTAILDGRRQDGLDLNLQVQSYDATRGFDARVVAVERLNTSEHGVFHIELDIADSGMHYRAGDVLYVKPESNAALLDAMAIAFGAVARSLFDGKELRLLSKSVLRYMASASANADLKDKLKVRNRAQLADYLYGKDVLDVVNDCGGASGFDAEALAAKLSDLNPRAYSIASSGVTTMGQNPRVSLCVREVSYEASGRERFGAASYPLCTTAVGDAASVFTRANTDFRLEARAIAPLILVGAGTGIAPYIGFLEDLAQSGVQREVLLVFGERRSDQDFLYQQRLVAWQSAGVLDHLVTAFSRDQASKYYVQHALQDNGELVWRLLEEGGHVYVCGSRDNLAFAVDDAFQRIVVTHGGQSARDEADYWASLGDTGRLHKDLY